MAKTIAVHTFHNLQELMQALAAITSQATRYGSTPDTVLIDTGSDMVRLTEDTLSDGSKVHNIEFLD